MTEPKREPLSLADAYKEREQTLLARAEAAQTAGKTQKECDWRLLAIAAGRAAEWAKKGGD
jgi:hypothetical protein